MTTELDFKRAKVFRRTGRCSFAVQLEGCPGVVEVHCIDQDWGHMATGSRECVEDLEDRLCTIGTRNMFAWSSQAQRMVPSRARHIEWEEGVQVALGPYDVRRRAFVQCVLRVVEASAAVTTSPPLQAEESCGVDATEHAAGDKNPRDMIQEGGRRRAFKWGFWKTPRESGGMC